MIKSVICIVTAVFFIVINTIILFLKPNFIYAKNDYVNYCVYYKKWLRSCVYVSTITIALFCIDFSINLNHILAYSSLVIECLLVIIYALVKYKGITVSEEAIKVQRLFRKDLELKFENIANVLYLPNAKIVIKLKNRNYFDVSFNSENFRRFYLALIDHNIKFKTSRVPGTENHVCLVNYNMVIRFPNTMFREYYQQKSFFRNGRYCFSARSLDNHEYIEGYYKDSGKSIKEFIELVKNDLAVNDFKYIEDSPVNLDGFDFTVIRSNNKNNDLEGRLAYIYKSENNYFILYADYLIANEESFIKKINSSIARAVYEDGKNKIVRI